MRWCSNSATVQLPRVTVPLLGHGLSVRDLSIQDEHVFRRRFRASSDADNRQVDRGVVGQSRRDRRWAERALVRTSLHKDLKTLGYRPRRQHDTRRTFISLCLSDGARKDILKWVTHSRRREDQMDDYTTLLWNPLCDEVAKLKINMRREPLRAVAIAGSREVIDSEPGPLVTGLVTSPKPKASLGNPGGFTGRCQNGAGEGT